MDSKITVALVYDFDGTLSPGNMQEYHFIPTVGRTTADFWGEANNIAKEQDADGTLTYMALMISAARKEGVPLSREAFRQSGSHVKFYEGVEEWFSRINAYGAERGIEVLHYVNSSGLMEMIEGTSIAHEFRKIYACSFLYDQNGDAYWPAAAVNYTNKTQFIFKINKGVESVYDSTEVNRFIEEEERPVPFKHIVFIGDGTTDIPCMRLVKNFGGHSIAVHNPSVRVEDSGMASLIRDNRVNHVCPANYTPNSPIDTVIKTILDKVETDHRLNLLEIVK